jgi:hypothetical protein
LEFGDEPESMDIGVESTEVVGDSLDFGVESLGGSIGNSLRTKGFALASGTRGTQSVDLAAGGLAESEREVSFVVVSVSGGSTFSAAAASAESEIELSFVVAFTFSNRAAGSTIFAVAVSAESELEASVVLAASTASELEPSFVAVSAVSDGAADSTVCAVDVSAVSELETSWTRDCVAPSGLISVETVACPEAPTILVWTNASKSTKQKTFMAAQRWEVMVQV